MKIYNCGLVLRWEIVQSFLPLSWKGRSVAYESSIDGPAQQSRLSAHFSPNIFLHGWLSLRWHKDIYQKYKYKYTSVFLPKLKKLFILVTHLRCWDVLATWNWDYNRKHCLQTFLCCLFFSLHRDCQVIVIIIAAPPAPFMYSAKARQPSHAMQTVANLRSISSSSRSSSPLLSSSSSSFSTSSSWSSHLEKRWIKK